MSIKSLTGIVLTTALTLGITGCGESHSAYWFDGKIGDEHVQFWEYACGGTNVLKVEKPDGSKIKYIDNKGDDLLVDEVRITVGDNTTTYYRESPNLPEIEEFVKDKAQQSFEDYLQKIHKIQTAPLNME
jgi:hypothetical protein